VSPARQESAIVSLIRSRASRADRSAVSGAHRTPGVVVALVVTLGLLLVAGCGMNAQTSKPYTPAEGINVDVGDPAQNNLVVHVRNLLIIAKAPGQGVLSASLVTNNRDSLTKVSGNPIKLDGSDGAPFTVTMPNAVTIANGAEVVLTGMPLIVLSSPDLVPGLSATITLQFENAGQTTLKVPIEDGNQPQYASISPPPATPSA
jgi:hypothetical protein